MSMKLMPEKIGAEYMIALAKYEGVDIRQAYRRKICEEL
jgi:hypothetical protein